MVFAIEGLKAMSKRAESELEPKRQQLADTVSLINKSDGKIRRLSSVIADTEDDTALSALKAELNNTAKQRAALIAEQTALGRELEQKELTTQTQAEIKQVVAQNPQAFRDCQRLIPTSGLSLKS